MAESDAKYGNRLNVFGSHMGSERPKLEDYWVLFSGGAVVFSEMGMPQKELLSGPVYEALRGLGPGVYVRNPDWVDPFERGAKYIRYDAENHYPMCLVSHYHRINLHLGEVRFVADAKNKKLVDCPGEVAWRVYESGGVLRLPNYITESKHHPLQGKPAGLYVIDSPRMEIDEEKKELVANMEQVEHPKHYCSHPSGVECIQVTEWMNFNLGNAIKYIWRASLKGKELQDLKKAVWYIQREIERINGNKP